MTSSDPGAHPHPPHNQTPAVPQMPPQQPGQVPDGAPGAAPGKPGRGITVWHVLTAVLAIVSLVLAGLLIVRGGGQVGSSARSSAAAACDLIHQFPDDGVDLDDEAAFEAVYLLNGAQVLAELAAEQDESYAELRGAMRGPRAVQVATFSMDSPEFIEALNDARAAC